MNLEIPNQLKIPANSSYQIVAASYKQVKTIPGYRLGQAIHNNLPVYLQTIRSSELFELDGKNAEDYFYENYVN